MKVNSKIKFTKPIVITPEQLERFDKLIRDEFINVNPVLVGITGNREMTLDALEEIMTFENTSRAKIEWIQYNAEWLKKEHVEFQRSLSPEQLAAYQNDENFNSHLVYRTPKSSIDIVLGDRYTTDDTFLTKESGSIRTNFQSYEEEERLLNRIEDRLDAMSPSYNNKIYSIMSNSWFGFILSMLPSLLLLGFYLQITPEKVSNPFFALLHVIAIILIVSMPVFVIFRFHNKIITRYFPKIWFAIGVQKQLYDESREIMKNVFWVIVAGFFVSLSAGILLYWFT